MSRNPITRNSPQAKPRPTRELGRYVARITLVFLFGFGCFLSLLPLGRASLRAALLLPALLTASEPASMTLVDVPVYHTKLTLNSLSSAVYVDVYAPTTPPPSIPGARGGVIIIPGVGDNRTVSQLVNFSVALAHADLVVMDMTTPTLIGYNISAQDSETVIQVFKAMTHRPGVGPGRIGIIGFSGGGPLACFAAADPRIHDQVAFITLSGSYYNATSLLHAFGRRALTVGGSTQPWHPTEVPIQTLANIITEPLPRSEAKLLVRAFAPGGKPLTSADLARLSPGSVAAYHLLSGDAPDQVDANIAELPPQVRMLLEELSPSTVIDKIRAPIYLLHDRSDQSIPFTESRDFAAALTRLHHPHDFAEFGIFQHVEMRTDLGASQFLNDGPALFRLLSEILLSSS